MSLLGGAPPAKLLRSIEVVVLVSSAQTFLWQGNHSTVFQRWAGLRLARLFSTEGSFGVCRVMEGAESALFCSHFVLPQPSSLTAQLEVLAPLPAPLPGGETFPGLSEQVAELHRGKRLQGISTAEPGDVVVWEIAERAEPVRMISREAHGLFRTDRTYVILSTQFTPERRKQHRLYFWVGANADRHLFLIWKFQLAGKLAENLPLRSQETVEQHCEPRHFFSIFGATAPVVFLACGTAEQAEAADAVTENRTTGPPICAFEGVLHVGGPDAAHVCARQASSLNSFGSFVLQSAELTITWHGTGSRGFKRRAADELARSCRGSRRALSLEEGEQMPIDGSSAIAFPSPSPTHGTSATLLPADPRLFRLMSTNGRYEITEVPGFFCRLQLCSEHTFFLDAYDHAFVWAGARSRDVDVRLAHRFAALYLRAAEDGRPSSTAEEINEEAEPPGFLTHFQVWEDPTRSFDAYAAHLVAAKRDAMFGKLRPSASIYVDAQAGRYSQEWVRDVEALENGDRGVLERYANDHHQEELEWTGVCVLVTSLHANRLKAARCARLLARLDNAKVRYSAYDLAAPQHQHARMLAALALRAKGRSALLLLQLPLLFKDGDLLLVGTDAAQGGVLGNELKDEDVQAGSTSEALLARLRKQPANWSRLQHWEDERRLAGLLGQALDPDSAASKPSRTMRQKLQKKISRNPHLPTLEEVRAEGVFTSESTRQEREGFLDKQGGMFKGSWERRFFVLTVQGVLYWFKDANENGHALGCVELQGEHSVTVKPLGVNLTFEIRTEEKDWRMRADSGKQLSCWLAAISSLNAAKSGRGKGADGSVAFPVQGGREHGARATRRLLPKGRATTHLDTLVAPLILDAPSVKSRVSATAGGAAAAAALSWPRQREGAGSAAADRNPSMLARAANEETPFPMTRRVQPKPVSFPFGLVRKLSRRGIIDHVFLCISESLLLYYDCSRKSQAAWTQLAGLASAGGWDAVRGTWVVGSKRELWVGGGAHDELVDMRHPRGVIPLNECRAEAATVDGADAITLAAYDGSASERQLRVLCGSPAERDAWLAAIREAREVSLHRLYTLQQSRFAAEEARDTFRRERDASRREAERLHEEIAVYKAARERAQNAGASSDAGLRVVLGGLRGADDELEEASTRIRELGRALERAASERRRAEEGSGRRAAELAQEQARVEELQRELEATRQQHTASVLELTDKLQVAEARAEAAEARVAALHAASSEQTAQMRGELEAAHKRLLRAEAAEAESRAACASGITALPTVALSAVRAGAPTAIALTLDAPIAGDGTSEATEADSDGTEHRDDAEGQEETPATAHSPPAASPSAAEVEAMRRRLHLDQERLAERRAQRAAARARPPADSSPPDAASAPAPASPSPLGSASPAAVQAHFEREQQAAPPPPSPIPRPLPPPSSHLPPPTSFPLASPSSPTHPHAPHPPHPPPPCLQLLAQRREERAERRRAREAVLKHDREADVGEAYISTAPEHVHIVGAAVPAASAPEASMSPKERRGDAAAEAELGDAAAEAELGDAAREATAQQEDAAESLDAEREASEGARRAAVERSLASAPPARSLSQFLAKPKLGFRFGAAGASMTNHERLRAVRLAEQQKAAQRRAGAE